MGIFQRLARLIKANVNALISKAEDPETQLEQLLREMNDQLIRAKKQVAVAIADEKRLAKQWEQEVRDAKEWERKAMVAVRAGDDALAKEALNRKRQHADLAEQFKAQWEGHKRAVEQLKLALTQLSAKIDEANRKKTLLIARKKRAEAQKAISETLAGITDSSAFGDFKRMEEKIDQMAAEAEAGVELYAEMSGSDIEAKFRRLEAGPGADVELEELKRKMGLLPPVEAAAPATPAVAVSEAGMTDERLEEEIEKLRKELAEEVPAVASAPSAEKKAGA